MDIIQVVKGDTGPQLKATVTRSDTGEAFVGSGTINLRVQKKAYHKHTFNHPTRYNFI